MVREGTQGTQLVLPIRGLRELGRVLSSCEGEDPVRILVDGAQAFFQFPGGEFSVRRIDTKFPAYEKFLAKDRTTWMVMDKITPCCSGGWILSFAIHSYGGAPALPAGASYFRPWLPRWGRRRGGTRRGDRRRTSPKSPFTCAFS